ncbi:MAG: tRNA (adenosine(37)-N6)-dimethylallyltransferase MiaA [SAR86 cluster bacterium]|jgi:tRNA dimethylallyltransferase|uniref:tRNA dimethylallyltransferase n=1 Tax=SAR86 cluster bacterium TaxID=2030880 RepID=A0A973A6X9_9GAMM|nr:tRNA (adenosine(37)-N6)-dimethylallyltransferase MiaA [SAR86 cluster bacterium]|tara:strand:+ start:42144 stop:43082 length:939 start_codon:yes stop_codon:yes gene_type:complete
MILSPPDQPPAIFLMGPTASGKSALALELADRLPVEIISVDSALVYRHMDIGTAKPDKATLAQYPHHLVNIREPSEPYSVAEFRSAALTAMADITARGKIPLLVGGTMLYFKALKAGLANLPAANPQVRADIALLASEQGWAAVHRRLAEVDSVSAQRIHVNDPQRLSRALEVYEITGRSMTDWHSVQPMSVLPYRCCELAIVPPDRLALHKLIAERFQQMLDLGFVEEVRSLRRRESLSNDLPALRSVGYRQVWDYLEGALSYDEMRDRGVIATRQLAKRQYTWLRGWIALQQIDAPNVDQALKILRASII